ncbi:uncharacterized protein FIBRA_04462 [Fibroporia radiculosa]|uniref:Pumilio homology domain family member 3 n=1 Tax=Fibroporia radiculosa TaxID=599839 RepID=J4HWJ4_9APHY|nr:uncharacterized protein FIBRA_04462 [Fibroporia radiculosa]CCM02367.1 predicted protein [Fibroporia radiculosa]
MSANNSDISARRTSGSSTRSGAPSPSTTPTHAHSQRKPVSAGSMLGVGMASTNGLRALNSGWQVWGSSPTSTRNASTSSAASMPDSSASQAESSHRSNLGDAWSSRATGTTWDEMMDSPQKDVSQLDTYAMLSFSQGRSRHVSAGAALSTPTKQGQFSPQRFSAGLGRDSPNTSRYTPSSTTKPALYGTTSPYTGQKSLLQNDAEGTQYASLQPSSFVEDDLSMALRGMVVADDYSLGQQPQVYRTDVAGNLHPTTASQATQSTLPQIRAPPQPQQPRPPYSGYPQTDYTAFYNNSSGRVDYAYPYDAFRASSDPSLYAPSPALSATATPSVYPGMPSQPLHPHAVADIHGPQSGVYYDYSGSPRPMGSQYYYPTQPLVYHPPPSHSPMDKKRDLQYNMQHPHQPNVMFPNVRATPSPHPQAFHGTVDYQHPLMVPGGTIYGHAGMGPLPMHAYHHGGRGNRRGDVRTDHRVAIRSPLLDDFRANKTRKWELKDIYGYIVEFSGDQHGSRFIQQKLETATADERQVIFDEIVPHNVLQLIQDVFGNYVIQKLFEHGTQVQKTILANAMESHVLPLSLQMYGCRVVQKAVEHVLPEQQSNFVKELDASVLRCVKDANGNHVIQKLIERVPPERLMFIKAFKGNVYDLATHPYGCRVLQRCFEHLPDEYTRPLLDELHKHVTHLMQDQFGNYVVQFVLEHGKAQDRAVVITKLRGQMLHMARHKFASNVVEKALITADLENRRALIDEIMAGKPDGISPILTMMKDQFANYVLQRALSVVEGEQREALVSKVRPQLANMRRYSSAYSKHLVAIERLLEKAAPTQGDTSFMEGTATATRSDALTTKSS